MAASILTRVQMASALHMQMVPSVLPATTHSSFRATHSSAEGWAVAARGGPLAGLGPSRGCTVSTARQDQQSVDHTRTLPSALELATNLHRGEVAWGVVQDQTVNARMGRSMWAVS